jgi:hypothetical protein
MKLSMIVNPFTPRNLQWAAQVGVDEIVLTFPHIDPYLKRPSQAASSPANNS